jgi:hypothetical protein
VSEDKRVLQDLGTVDQKKVLQVLFRRDLAIETAKKVIRLQSFIERNQEFPLDMVFVIEQALAQWEVQCK